MNEKINLDLVSLKLIFNRNKSYIYSVIIILVSIILFFQFVIPQFNALLKAQEEAKELSLRLEVLKGNLNVLTNIDEEVLNSRLKTLTLALPVNKDVVGILNSLYSVAQKTGVSFGDFSFTVGDISKSENDDNLPSIKISVLINADVKAVNSFVEIMSKTVPLSEIKSIKVEEVSSTVVLSFYYKPLGAANYRQDVQISPLSQRGLTLINELSEFETSSSLLQLQATPTATSSGQK